MVLLIPLTRGKLLPDLVALQAQLLAHNKLRCATRYATVHRGAHFYTLLLTVCAKRGILSSHILEASCRCIENDICPLHLALDASTSFEDIENLAFQQAPAIAPARELCLCETALDSLQSSYRVWLVLREVSEPLTAISLILKPFTRAAHAM